MDRNLPSGCTADFNHIVQLFQLESTMSLKKAHKLTPATLHLRSTEKTSVKLAVSVFCESTRDAVQFYATHDGQTAWVATANFITLLLKVWNVLNVRTKTKGKHKKICALSLLKFSHLSMAELDMVTPASDSQSHSSTG